MSTRALEAQEVGTLFPKVSPFISEIKNHVLSGREITRVEALRLISIPICDKDAINELIEAAHEITEKCAPRRAELCSLINAKSGACSENCKFCGQSVHHNTDIPVYPFVGEETILKRAQEIEKMGAGHYCLVTAQKELKGEVLEKIIRAFSRLRQETNLRLDASIGILDDERARRLKEAGVSMVNHNLESSERYFAKICSTHSYEDRKQTIRAIKNNGMEVCAGGIIGMGETGEDRIDMAFSLKEFDVDVIPVNILNPLPGTPLENVEKIHPLEAIKTVAVFRFIFPTKIIKLAGGREVNLGDEWQPLALRAGANGLIIGGYLTTGGNSPEKDIQMLREAGYEVPALQQ